MGGICRILLVSLRFQPEFGSSALLVLLAGLIQRPTQQLVIYSSKMLIYEVISAIEAVGRCMEEDGPSIDVLMETWSRYRPARLDLLSRLHRPKSLRDPVCEWSEMLVKQLLHGRFPVKPDQSIDPVRKDYDVVLDKDGTQVQIKSLSNLSGKWVNEHLIQFTGSVGAYAIVFFTDLRPETVLIFPKQQLKHICERLRKRHPKQDTELQLTQRNFGQILAEKRAFAYLAVCRREAVPPSEMVNC